MKLELKKSVFNEKVKAIAQEMESREGRKVELIKRKILKPSTQGINVSLHHPPTLGYSLIQSIASFPHPMRPGIGAIADYCHIHV